jgi:adenosylhomocysteine nucleosidase
VSLTGVICAIDTEAKPFLNVLTDDSYTKHAGLDFHKGEIDGTEVVVVCAGVGKVNTAMAVQILIDSYGVKRIIMSGTAGGMDKRLKVGDTVVITESGYHDTADNVHKPAYYKSDLELISDCRAVLRENPPKHSVYFGRCVTGETFIIKEGRSRILKKHVPLCVDMETAAAAHVCHSNGVPFLAVRSVTDMADDVGYGSFYENVAFASRNSFLVVESIFKRLNKAVSI